MTTTRIAIVTVCASIGFVGQWMVQEFLKILATTAVAEVLMKNVRVGQREAARLSVGADASDICKKLWQAIVRYRFDFFNEFIQFFNFF